MGISSSTTTDAFAICIQGGAILAVLGLYRKQVFEMAQGAIGRNPQGFRLASAILAAFIPAAILGLLLEKTIKKYLFAGDEWGLWPVIAAWFVGGVAILAAGAWNKRKQPSAASGGLPLSSITLPMAVIIGLAQCIAMWPGVSRSLVTIVGGLLVGLSIPAAVEFSFLLGVVTLSAATILDAYKHGTAMLEEFGPSVLITGGLAAWISAVIAVKWMVGYLQSHGLSIFGWYRIVLAIAVATMICFGFLPA